MLSAAGLASITLSYRSRCCSLCQHLQSMSRYERHRFSVSGKRESAWFPIQSLLVFRGSRTELRETLGRRIPLRNQSSPRLPPQSGRSDSVHLFAEKGERERARGGCSSGRELSREAKSVGQARLPDAVAQNGVEKRSRGRCGSREGFQVSIFPAALAWITLLSMKVCATSPVLSLCAPYPPPRCQAYPPRKYTIFDNSVYAWPTPKVSPSAC